ncbi:UDP-glucuronosyltransferase 2B9-like isoform X2 [Odontomachus brunneus]|uniref:UDP-glucuronosyltransferase 2B9-like isoform X2 n=1 Tax=Odontomachus brunneus TaxID=486640 RepID=UPI0013F23E18|nr:UDP-glucuronosyltransferase 2B9-like isoform X2 [Odontomachus brunneus]XP_032684088.1 UDP-glucuronosyltransferase 2B9-like isoform X2 [Odontomachus brunneus]XP_032684089.1 UDP-glucuronosyltransferase 2B9-like isoform X2 [Odontomachus brunneus]
MVNTTPAFWLACFLGVITLTESARILVVSTIPSYSHLIPFQSLWTALSQRGHKVVVLTTNPVGDLNLTNLTEIDLRSQYGIFTTDYTKLRFISTWLDMEQNIMWDIFTDLTKNILEHQEVRKLYAPNSGEQFDVVFIEIHVAPAIYALAHRFNAPVIGIWSLPLPSDAYYNLGVPVLPSHPSTWEMEYRTGFNLSLWQRMKNFIRLWHFLYYLFNQFVPQQQALVEKYLGKVPDINEMMKNISIIFCSQREITSFSRPQSLKVIQTGNLHIMKEPPPLSNNLEKFLNDTPNGFIYVSLGTNVKVMSLPNDVQRVFYNVLTSLPYKIVWKFDGHLPDKYDNIYIAKWFPQRSILAHPNIKLFIYQGGLQSTEEAIHYGVPLLGIPILADQCTNINKMTFLGVAKSLDITTFSEKELNSSIMDIITDKRYKERMLDIKALSNDEPYNRLENAIWWTEFVIRHKGAPHLHTNIAHEPWYKRYDMDVIAILSIVMFVVLICTSVIIYKLLKIIILKYFWIKISVDIKKKIT